MNSGAVLVTGGAGYVGAHTCKALSKAGYLPVVVIYPPVIGASFAGGL